MSTAGVIGLADEGRPPLRPITRPVSPGALVTCAQSAHGRDAGVDESARRLSHEELVVARQLAEEGHHVRSLGERPGRGPVADLDVCGNDVEVKSFLSLAEREGRVPTARSVCNKLLGARAQAPTAVLLAGASGLSESSARDGVEEFVRRRQPGRVTGVWVIGEGFDLAWSLGRAHPLPAPEAGRYEHPSTNRRKGPELGLA